MSDDPPEVILARIETKLDRALADVGDHERRIRRLELAVVASAAIGAGGGWGLVSVFGS